MHELMEYLFEPGYKRLKTAMAAAPADKGGWKAIKGDSLTLAESANVLLGRGPEKETAKWNRHAVQVRQAGGSFYQAAKKRDYAAATSAWRLLLNRCNACHKDFADGEHQLMP